MNSMFENWRVNAAYRKKKRFMNFFYVSSVILMSGLSDHIGSMP